MSKLTAIIFGVGKNIGAATTQKLLSKGYRVAQVSRSGDAAISSEDTIHLKADLSHHEEVSEVFAKVRQTWGEPNVVIYNGEIESNWIDRRTCC